MNRKIAGGKTFLMHAASSGQIHLVRRLLAMNADANLKDSDGKTAEAYAAQNDYHDIAYLLRIARSESWHNFASNEKSVKLLMNQLNKGQSLERILQSDQHSNLRSLLVDNVSHPTVTWFLLHKRYLIGYDENNNLCWLINGNRYQVVL